MDVTVLEAEALRLEPAARGRLAERLFESLLAVVEPEVEQVWIEEALARDEAIESGNVEAIPADEVLRDARSRLT